MNPVLRATAVGAATAVGLAVLVSVVALVDALGHYVGMPWLLPALIVCAIGVFVGVTSYRDRKDGNR